MLTKTVRFDDEVLNVLRGMDWRDGGTLGILHGQLERPLYERVNKALEIMGGKWNRKAGGHVFPDDRRGLVDGLLDSGTLEVTRDGFFETPAPVIDRMLALALPEGRILEPSAGRGAIVERMVKTGRAISEQITCVEKDAGRATYLRDQGYYTLTADFLAYEPEQRFDTILMNPPFEEGQDMAHIRHAFDLLKEGGVLVSVVSESPFFRNTAAARAFRAWLEAEDASSFPLPEHAFRASGTDVNCRLIVLLKGPGEHGG